MQNDFKPSSREIFKPSNLQLFKGVDILKLKLIAVAVTLTLPMVASAETNDEMKNEIELLKAQVNQLSILIKQKSTAPESAASVDPAEFNQLRTKVDSLLDDKEVTGFNGLRITGGIDPTYIYNQAKGTSSFAFLNNAASINGSGEVFAYDNSTWGLAYLDIQKEMEGGTKMRLTLMPSKSAGSAFNWGNIVHEAYASIPLSDSKTRLLVGQFADVSGYQPWLNTYIGANSIYSNQLFPGYGEYFITKNLLFDFTNPYFYTGIGVDLVRGPWETRLYLANFNSARNDINGCPAATQTSDTNITSPTTFPQTTVTGSNLACPSTSRNTAPTFIYNATYAKDEYWGFEFTGYEGVIANPMYITNNALPANSQLDQFEIDANFTRAEFNGNVQFTVGQQKDAAYNGGKAEWWGVSTLLSQRVLPKLTLAARVDYLNNHKNGGGTYATATAVPSSLDNGGSVTYLGDFYNGFGPGDPNAPGYDANKGADRSSLTLSSTYRLTSHVAFRGEIRYDHATTPSFYNWSNQTFSNSNQLYGLQTVVNF
jgi:hypothetical protein